MLLPKPLKADRFSFFKHVKLGVVMPYIMDRLTVAPHTEDRIPNLVIEWLQRDELQPNPPPGSNFWETKLPRLSTI
jgi:hypothetical protein